MVHQQSHCIPEILRQKAQYSPDALAILAPGRNALTYANLYHHTTRVVETFNYLGIGRNDRVAILLPNSPEMAVAFLSVACVASSAPLNPAYGKNEFSFYLSDLETDALVILDGMESPARQVAFEMNIPLIELLPQPDASAGLFSLQGKPKESGRKTTGFSKADDVALLLHTSGTTSRPKMVPLSHTNVCASARHIQATLMLTEKDRCLNVMPLFHIHGLMAAVLSSINAGASIYCTPGFDAEHFFKWMDESHPSWYTAVPTMHQSILSQAKSQQAVIQRNPLRFIRSSSASLPPTVMADLERVFNAPVIESYGMTEAAHQMASNPLPPMPRKPGSVGLAAGPDVAIMDEVGKLLTTEVRGEVVIRGPNVMSGYLNNPQANQTSFKDHWFRTGDQGYLDEDGYLFITGRLKEMINRGGEKVIPREVDEVLMAHPSVLQAVTFAVPHTTLGEDVAAAVVLKPGANENVKQLREFALRHIALHKVPSQVVIVDQIPKGPTGKLMRIGLYEKLAPRMKPMFEPPCNQIEEALVRLWKYVLGERLQDPLSVHDNFFALGGDSLLATQLLARIRLAFEVDLPSGSIFRFPTVSELAVAVENTLLNEIEGMSDEDVESSRPEMDP